jgi:hypothetical protein
VYRACIFCSAALGANEAIESFPVGKSLAFDAARGRLWAVCPKCARWNLAPIEERWEAVEEAEKRFRGARLRAQSENVGLAKLPDGTRLIRVGAALPGELAAWRYGDQLVRRFRVRLPLQVAVCAAVGAVNSLTIAAVGAIPVVVSLAVPWLAFGIPQLVRHRQSKRVAFRLPAERSPTGREIRIHRRELHGLRVVPDEGGGIAVEAYDVRDASRTEPLDIRLLDSDARTLLGRAMVHANQFGATRRGAVKAAALLGEAGSADEYLRSIAERRLRVFAPITFRQFRLGPRGQPADTFRHEGIALEMALHEATERRALEGDLAALEAAWRDAEEIAAIADALPDDPLPRLKGA